MSFAFKFFLKDDFSIIENGEIRYFIQPVLWEKNAKLLRKNTL